MKFYKPKLKFRLHLPPRDRKGYNHPTQNPLLKYNNFIDRYRHIRWKLEHDNDGSGDGNPITITYPTETELFSFLDEFCINFNWDNIALLLHRDISDEFKSVCEGYFEDRFNFYKKLCACLKEIDVVLYGDMLVVLNSSMTHVPLDTLVPYLIVALSMVHYRLVYTYSMKGPMIGESFNDAAITDTADEMVNYLLEGKDIDELPHIWVKRLAAIYDQINDLLQLDTYRSNATIREFVRPSSYMLTLIACLGVYYFDVDAETIISED